MGTKKAARKGKPLGDLLRMSPTKRAKSKSTYVRGTVFFIMAFSKTEKAYSVMRDTCQTLGLKVTRADENPGSGLIIADIYDGIKDAQFIICDLTNARPNVYYELGYAHGLGNSPENVLLIAKQETEVSFDIAGYRVDRYRSLEELRSKVSAAVAGWLPKRSKKR